MASTIVWFRLDLRLEDNPALQAAIELGQPIVPVYILDDESEGDWKMGGASRWWLHHALEDLSQQLEKHGLKLVLKTGDSLSVLKELIQATQATAVYWNRRYEPLIIERDKTLKTSLKDSSIDAQSFNGSLLFEPHTIKNKTGKPYQVFTPYWRQCRTLPTPAPVKVSLKKAIAPKRWPRSETLQSLQLLPTIEWDSGFYDHWTPTIAGAKKRLKTFLGAAVNDYDQARDLPGTDGTSQLSPYLHFGQISPRQIWHAVDQAGIEGGRDIDRYLAEIGWREFSYHLLFHFPHTTDNALREEYRSFPWNEDDAFLKAWQRGKTGYPIVDAGMRQLWITGWMHNRVRMIVASFLVKHLLQPWQAGANWFWDTLVDADLASNTQGWQWTAGCGADASPYFRVFNPITQGEKFDKEGEYVRRWVPELAKLPNQYIYQPWNAPDNILEYAGVTLGDHYPEPIIHHNEGRSRALDAYAAFSKAK